MQFDIIVLMLVTIIGLSMQSSCSAQSTSCSTLGNLRLYNPHGSTATQGGMLQICISNRWRAMCDYSFSCSIEGIVACRQLGYSGSQIRSIVMLNSARYFGTWSFTDSYYYYYSCSSSSYSSFASCSAHSAPSLCDSTNQVGIQCMTLPSTECSNKAVRLVGGQSSNEGRLEYCYYGAWNQLCSTFRNKEAIAACRQLGYTNPKAAIITDGQFGRESNYSLINSFSCPSLSSVRNLSSCSLSASPCGYRCTGNSLGISCYVPGQDGCREGAVRLVNSTTEYEGRVEVCLDGVWGTVCGMDYGDAAVICRTAGFDGVLEYYSTNHVFGDGGRPINYNIYCGGSELNIKKCSKDSYPNIYCNRASVGGVRCHHGCTDGEVRLIGGSSETEGTVEVCHNKTWEMVSGLGWGEEDARVTCRQLQFSVKGFHSYANSPFGKPRRTVHFSSVRCVGSELRITDCPTTNYTYEQGKLLAGHLAVAGVACKQYCPISTPPPVELTTTQYVTSECPAATTTQFTTTKLSTVELTVTTCPATTQYLTTLSTVESTSECLATTQFTTTLCPSATSEYQVKTVTACPRTIDFSPTQPVSVTDNSQQTVTTILLIGLTAIFGTATVTLAVCMCYSLYKISKNKRYGHGPQGPVDNQYGSQPNEMSSNAITHNASYKQATSPSAYTEESQQTVYERIQLQ